LISANANARKERANDDAWLLSTTLIWLDVPVVAVVVPVPVVDEPVESDAVAVAVVVEPSDEVDDDDDDDGMAEPVVGDDAFGVVVGD
jgi:hypothetical protein